MWIIADLFLRICERFGDLASQGALVKGVDKVCDLDLRELFVEGKERVHVDLQQPCQRRQECDVWKRASALPFIDSRRCHAQCVSDLLLREVVGFAVSADLFTNVHDDDLL